MRFYTKTPEPRRATGAHPNLVDDKELPDARLTAADRQFVKRVIARLEHRLGVDGLMFAAAGCEAAAVRKRDEEGNRGT
jgi:hypothetical protein